MVTIVSFVNSQPNSEKLKEYQDKGKKLSIAISEAQQQLNEFQQNKYGTSSEREEKIALLKQKIEEALQHLEKINNKIRKYSGQVDAKDTPPSSPSSTSFESTFSALKNKR